MPLPSGAALAVPSHSFVLEYRPATPREAVEHFTAKLAVETDPYDVHQDLARGAAGVVVVDARPRKVYEECHIPGAVSLPYRAISADTTRALPKDGVIVTYCDGVNCNASAKAALRLATLGFSVKEMVGGLEYWRREGLPVDGTLGKDAPIDR